jgi:hypothetical protein
MSKLWWFPENQNQMPQLSSNQESSLFAISDNIFRSRKQSIEVSTLNDTKLSHRMSLGE